MNIFYKKYIEKENEYYRSLLIGKPSDGPLSPQTLNDAINWLCDGSKSALDFGCGSGGLLFCCAFRGVKELVGIDLAEEGIQHAIKCTTYIPDARFRLLQGSVEQLRHFPDSSFDSLILSNILDNMRPEDALSALSECVRVLKPGGRALIKLNSYLSVSQMVEWNVRVIEDDLLDDGMLLWNQSDKLWLERLRGCFSDIRLEDVYYEEHDIHNRLFLCVK